MTESWSRPQSYSRVIDWLPPTNLPADMRYPLQKPFSESIRGHLTRPDINKSFDVFL